VSPNSPTGQYAPKLARDDLGGAFVVWDEASRSLGRIGLYTQRFMTDGPVAIEIALASVEAEPDRVVLVWYGPGAGALAGVVERRGESTPWQEIGTASAEGADRLVYEDREVAPGARYAYRLRHVEDSVARFTVETWVDVPPALALALEGFRPNPVRGGTAAIAFTLPGAAPAQIELFDLSGRRLWGATSACSAPAGTRCD
jgi:hypothetical protein